MFFLPINVWKDIFQSLYLRGSPLITGSGTGKRLTLMDSASATLLTSLRVLVAGFSLVAVCVIIAGCTCVAYCGRAIVKRCWSLLDLPSWSSWPFSMCFQVLWLLHIKRASAAACASTFNSAFFVGFVSECALSTFLDCCFNSTAFLLLSKSCYYLHTQPCSVLFELTVHASLFSWL